MDTFKQYILQVEMGGDVNAGFIGRRNGNYDDRMARRKLTPILYDADRLLRRRDKLQSDELKIQAQKLLDKFVSGYESLGDEATDLKGKIADRYTKIKQLLKSQNVTGA